MWFSNRDVSDTAVTIFTMTEAMLMKLQVSFKNYLEFSAENEAKRHCVKSVRIRSYSGFWSEFSRIRTKYEEILRISPYSVQMLENADQNNSENGHFLRSERYAKDFKINSFGKQNSYHLIG